ncbi:MAG: FtsX-like permease family protein, partial [Acidobacteria bacterium]|nr:FtsX-like permease family protein [Acidobacteriota bacterium]
ALSRMIFFAACLSVGVAAIVAVAGLSQGLSDGIRGEARSLLAADLVVSGSRPLPAALDGIVAGVPGLRRADLREMATMAAALGTTDAPGRSLLVQLKVVDGGYPFYGRLELDPPRPLDELLAADTAVVGPELVTRLGLSIGSAIRIGGQRFRVAGIVRAEPDRAMAGFAIGPRVFVDGAGLERAGLDARGSRVEHKALLALEGDDGTAAEALAERLRRELPEATWYDVDTWREGQPALREGLKRAERFLGLVALLSLLVGGIGVAQASRAWMASRLDAIAVLRALGVRPREVFALYLGQAALLGATGSAAGAALGVLLSALAPLLLQDLLPAVPVRFFSAAAALRGLALGTLIAVAFSVPSLAAVWRVPPVRVLRRDAEPLAAPWPARLGLAALVSSGVFLSAWAQAGALSTAAAFTLGIAGMVAALAAGAWLVARLVGRGPRQAVPVWVRHGLAALARPGAATIGAIVALGLGVTVVLAMQIVQARLAEQLGSDVPTNAPSTFLVDIQPDQWDLLRAALVQEGAEGIDTAPVVVGRLAAIDGRPIAELADPTTRPEDWEDGRRRWALTREQRITYRADLPEGNELVRGSLWSDPDHPELSIEEDFAQQLGVTVGSSLTLDVQGIPLEFRVTSIRRVEWRTFGINFFLLAEPGSLDDAPQFRLATLRLPAARELAVQDRLAAAFPNVTLINVRQILDRVAAIIARLGQAVRFLGLFTVVAGVLILAGAIGATAARRGREVAVLKTLGMTRSGVAAVFSLEYALIGLVAGTVGAVGAAVLAWAVLTRGMEIAWRWPWATLAAGAALATLLSVAAGLAASRGALAKAPVEVLRSEL